MEKINQFSIQRFNLLMKRFIMFNLKTWGIGLGAIAGILIIIALLQAWATIGTGPLSMLISLGQVMIFTGGYIITSMAYNEIHTPARSQFYLTLPATTLEKLFSHWIITSIVFVLLANILLMASLAVGSLLVNIGWGSPIEYYNPFTERNLQLMLIYVITQSMFFLGALYFRKNNFLKTTLSLIVISLAFNIFSVLVAYLLFGSQMSGVEDNFTNVGLETLFTETIPRISKILFYGVLAPFCLLVSYFRLKEREV